MTDEELMAALWQEDSDHFGRLYSGRAAARIEELLAERKRAVDAFVDLAIATLAEISSHNKGESHE